MAFYDNKDKDQYDYHRAVAGTLALIFTLYQDKGIATNNSKIKNLLRVLTVYAITNKRTLKENKDDYEKIKEGKDIFSNDSIDKNLALAFEKLDLARLSPNYTVSYNPTETYGALGE